MGYGLWCKQCGTLLGYVMGVSGKEFGSEYSSEWREFLSWENRVKAYPYTKSNSRVVCYKCHAVYTMYSITNGKKYVLRRVK